MQAKKLISLAMLLAMPTGAALAYDRVYMDGAVPLLGSDYLVIDNVRATGTGVTLSDAFRLEYSFNPATLGFTLANTTAYAGVGVYQDEHMAINVTPAQPNFTFDGNTYQSGQFYNFTASKATPFVARYSLKPGHVMSFLMSGQTGPYTYKVSGPGVSESGAGEANSGVISSSYKILTKGVYTITIKPQLNSTISFQYRSYNANNRTLARIGTVGYLSNTFLENARDYAKYLIKLNANQRVTVAAPNDSDIALKLVDRFGAKVQESAGVALIYIAPTEGNYYLFVYNRKGWGSGYNGLVTVTSAKTDESEAIATPGNGFSAAKPQ